MELKLKGACNIASLVEVPNNKKKNGAQLGVVSCTEEEGRVMRMKIVVKKSDLKQLMEVVSGVKGIAHRSTTLSSMSVPSSTVEQRLNNLLRKKYLSRAKSLNGNHHKCWSPVLQSIPEEQH